VNAPKGATGGKSEREKMLAGELYFASDPELVQLRRRARRLTRLYNDTGPDEAARRGELLRELFGAIGEHPDIEPDFRCDYGGQIFAGARFFANFGCVILDCARVDIGDSVLLGPSVHIYTATHPLDASLRASGAELAKPVRIGSRVWIGGGAIVLPGVTIGDDAVIGAGSVVTRDVPACCVAVGNPCRVVRTLG
jgi:maltose O-acetyltransferase